MSICCQIFGNPPLFITRETSSKRTAFWRGFYGDKAEKFCWSPNHRRYPFFLAMHRPHLRLSPVLSTEGMGLTLQDMRRQIQTPQTRVVKDYSYEYRRPWREPSCVSGRCHIRPLSLHCVANSILQQTSNSAIQGCHLQPDWVADH